MVINESKEMFAAFIDTHSKQLVDEMCLIQRGVYIEGPIMEKDDEPNQQLGDAHLLYSDSSIFSKWLIVNFVQDTSKIVLIASGYKKSARKQRYEIRPLNGTTKSVASPLILREIISKLADIPTEPSDTDAELLTEMMSRENL